MGRLTCMPPRVALFRDPADTMEQLAGDAHALAFEMREPRRSTIQSEQIIAEGERIASEIRRLVRG